MPKPIVDIDYRKITHSIKYPGPNHHAVDYLNQLYKLEEQTQTIFEHAKSNQRMLITMHLINLKYLIQKIELMY